MLSSTVPTVQWYGNSCTVIRRDVAFLFLSFRIIIVTIANTVCIDNYNNPLATASEAPNIRLN